MITPERQLHDYMAGISECTGIRRGSPLPLGTRERGDGVNFSIFSRHASRVEFRAMHTDEEQMIACSLYHILKRGMASE